jgi:membrane protease subunit (stomatin/prohibitin family)
VKLGSASVKSANIRGAVDDGGGMAQAMNATFSANAVSGSNAAYNSATMDSFSTLDSTETAAPAEVTVTNDVGITVPGSKVEQKFHTVYGFKSEAQSHVIILRLAGRAGAINIVAPVVARAKQKCTTCGHVNKANAKFCSECGTGLEIV